MVAASNRALSPLTVRTELACARTLLDELEARLASGNAHGGSRDLASQAADELMRVARTMKLWASLAEADVLLEPAR
jgi:predicted S18 family serine protease